MEDRTKRGLTVKENSFDEKLKVNADKGMIHDMDGIGHWIPIRWFFPKKRHDLEKILSYAIIMEKKYKKMREMTCPNDSN